MKVEANSKSLLFSSTSIPDVFFTEYLSIANGDYIKVYLYLLFVSKFEKDVKINDLSKSLSLEFKVIQEAIKFWEDIGAITRKANGFVINDLQEIELNKLYSPKITISPDEAVKINKSKNRAKVIDSINAMFFNGLMSPTWYTYITSLFEKYKFDEQVMLALFNYCYNHKALNKNYIQTVANAWCSSGIKTYSDLEKYYQNQEKIEPIKKKIARKLGLSRQLTEYETAYVSKWILDYKYDLPIIEIALKRTTSKTNPNFDYLDKLLSDWNERNLRTPEAVEEFLNSMKKKQNNIKKLNKNIIKSNYKGRKYDNFDSLYTNIK